MAEALADKASDTVCVLTDVRGAELGVSEKESAPECIVPLSDLGGSIVEPSCFLLARAISTVAEADTDTTCRLSLV
jgi:hypothetical protein